MDWNDDERRLESTVQQVQQSDSTKDRGERRGKVQKVFCEDDKGPKDWPYGQTAQRTVNSHNES